MYNNLANILTFAIDNHNNLLNQAFSNSVFSFIPCFSLFAFIPSFFEVELKFLN